MKFNFRRRIAMDLGTTSVLLYSRSKGVILEEPSVVAIDRFKDKIVAVGDEAKKMLGRTPGNIVALRPMKEGVIVDYRSTEKMLKYFIKKAVGRTLLKPDIIICVPSGATQVQKRAVIQAAVRAGAGRIQLMEEPLAAAIGAGVEVGDAGGNMVVDIGGGTTDIAVISLGGIVVSESIKVGGDSCDQAIIDYIRKNFNIIVGEKTAEDIKKTLGSVNTNLGDKYPAKGRNLFNGLPEEKLLTYANIEEALKLPIGEIVDTVHRVLSNTPPELAADLYERGVIMTGGGALIQGLAQKFEERIGIRVRIDENPVTAVVRGAGKALSWFDKLENVEEGHFEIFRRQIALRERLRRR